MAGDALLSSAKEIVSSSSVGPTSALDETLLRSSVIFGHQRPRCSNYNQKRFVRTGFFRSDPDFLDPESVLVRRGSPPLP